MHELSGVALTLVGMTSTALVVLVTTTTRIGRMLERFETLERRLTQAASIIDSHQREIAALKARVGLQ